MKKVNFKLVQSADEIKKDPAKVGQAVYGLMQKPAEYQEVGDTLQAMTPRYWNGLLNAIKCGKQETQENFYIVVLRKKEPWSERVLRQWFVSPVYNPSAKILREDYPNHDHDLWFFDQKTEDLVFKWSLPTAQDCKTILANPDLYDANLIATIVAFNSGKL